MFERGNHGERREYEPVRDAAFWELYANETEHGYLNKESELPVEEWVAPVQLSAAAEIGYTPESPKYRMEDRILFNQNRGIFGIFDGVGGGERGDVAAVIAAHVIHENLEKAEWGEAAVKLAFDAANGAVNAYNNEKYRLSKESDTSSTCATVLFLAPDYHSDDSREIILGHTGDSRGYIFRANGEIYRVTEDHNRISQHHPEAKPLSKEDRQQGKHRLTMAINGALDLKKPLSERMTLKRLRLAKDEMILLASDGVSDVLAANDKLALTTEELVYDLFITLSNQAKQYVGDETEFWQLLSIPYGGQRDARRDSAVQRAIRQTLQETVAMNVNSNRTLADLIYSYFNYGSVKEKFPGFTQYLLDELKEILELRYSRPAAFRGRIKIDNVSVLAVRMTP